MNTQHTQAPSRLAQVRMKHGIPLIVVSCLIQLLVPTHILAAHPLLETLLTALSPICAVLGLLILALVSLRFVFGTLAALGSKLHKKGQRGMCVLRSFLFGSQPDTQLASPKDVRLVWNAIMHLRTALTGMTPEMEQARQERYRLLGRPTPPLSILPHHAHLAGEYDALIRALDHVGISELGQSQPERKQVQLAQRDFLFLQQWQASLYQRLHLNQQRFQQQQEQTKLALFTVQALLDAIGQHPAMAHDPAYQRVTGGYELLTALAQENRVPAELLLPRAQHLRRDLEMLRERLRALRQQGQSQAQPATSAPQLQRSEEAHPSTSAPQPGEVQPPRSELQAKSRETEPLKSAPEPRSVSRKVKTAQLTQRPS